MIELPEAIILGDQLNKVLVGKSIINVFNATNLHRFTFFEGDPLDYPKHLAGRTVKSVQGYGIFVNILFDDNVNLCFHDGINIRFGNNSSEIPQKYQLLISFNDESFLVFSVAMYGGIYFFKDYFNNKYYKSSKESISPLSKDFNRAHFENIFKDLNSKNISVKALLASEQRIPGIGNGVLQDILFNAKINPKTKISTLKDENKDKLFDSLKNTIKSMTDLGGRDTEKDIFGNKGGYKTILSKNTYKNPCPKCNSEIIKETYMGGSVYYCSNCQKLNKY